MSTQSTISSGISEFDVGNSKSFSSHSESFQSVSESFQSVSDSFRSASESFTSTPSDNIIDDAIEKKEFVEIQSEFFTLSQSPNAGHINNQDFINVSNFPSTVPVTISGNIFFYILYYFYHFLSISICSEKCSFSLEDESWAIFDTQENFDMFEPNKKVISMGQLDNAISEQELDYHSQLLSFNNYVAFESITSTNQVNFALQVITF